MATIGILATIAVAAVNEARSRGREARASADLRQVRTAIALLEDDTGKWPNGCPPDTSTNPEVRLDHAQAGLRAQPTVGNQGSGCAWGASDVARWRGPYVDRVVDPWGTNYYFDPDYHPRENCAGQTWGGVAVPVVLSSGPNRQGNGTSGTYDCDDIFVRS